MAKVECAVVEDTGVNDDGYDVDCVQVTCGRCDHVVTSFGVGDPSIRRCFALLREECPEGEENYYVEE